MKLDDVSWPRIATLFDELAPLSPAERSSRVEQLVPDPDVLEWLERLLKAHDVTEPDLLDSQMDAILERLDAEANAPIRPSAATLVGHRFGAWRATGELSAGGTGVVLRGERADGHFEKQVAIKVLHPGTLLPEDFERLRAEIRILAALEHPGIVQLLDGGLNEDQYPFLVMELVDGTSITDFCRDHDLSLEERLRLLLRAARALSYSHRKLILHRDIKPSNLLVTRDGQIKLLDFDVSSRLAATESESGFPKSPFRRLTPGYAAPEQFTGAPISVVQDIFSFGAVLYEVVSGQRLRRGSELTTALVTGELPRSEDALARLNRYGWVDFDLTAICARAIAEDPDARYESIDALAADIENWLGHYPVAARGGGQLYRLGLMLRRNRLAAAMSGLAMFTLLSGSAVAIWQANQAWHEAERARVEQVAAEDALARMRSVQDFLLDLFQASTPDRPKSELPTTEELLEQGAGRALSASIEDAGQRIDLLLTIASIYLAHDRYSEAEPLVSAALELAESGLREEEMARALMVRSQLARTQGDLESAEIWLLEARDHLPVANRNWTIPFELDIALSWVWIQMTRYAEAYQLLASIYFENPRWEELPFVTRFHALNNLAMLYLQREQPRQALEMRQEIDSLLKNFDVPSSLRSVANVANTALLHYNLGNYELAKSLTQDVLERLDQIFEGPHSWRALNLRTLAYAQLQLGRLEQGASSIELAAQELAMLLNVKPETLTFALIERGWIEQRFKGQNEAALPWLEAAMESLEPKNLSHRMEYIWTVALLARGYCLSGRTEAGWALIEQLQTLLPGDQPESFQQRAELHESRATCHFVEGRFQQAMDDLDLALAGSLPPGRAKERSDCWLLRARIHLAQKQEIQAQAALDAATAVYLDLGLEQHPQLTRIAALREELSHRNP